MFDEKAQDSLNVTRDVSTDTAEVNQCPLCHMFIKPYKMSSYLSGPNAESEYLQQIIRCPSCHMLFLALYKNAHIYEPGTARTAPRSKTIFRFERAEPYRPSKQPFTDNIKTISPSFCDIYDQSKNAEDLGLNEICGVGYRKALEFLIKDYLISKKTELGIDEAVIKAASLGDCIKKYIKEQKIQEMAELATWLGNDETHYVRKWETKDLSDLKELINLTVDTIDGNMILAKHKKDMKPT